MCIRDSGYGCRWVRQGETEDPDDGEQEVVEESLQQQPGPEPEPEPEPEEGNQTPSPKPPPPIQRKPVGPPIPKKDTQSIDHLRTCSPTQPRVTTSPVVAIRTEEYEPDYGKYRPMTETIKDSRYPVRYAVTRNNPHTHPRVTTLARPDGSKTRHSECLREGYNWTSVGKYHGMAEVVTKINRTGRFKPPSTYPRFCGETEEEKLKKVFAQTIKAREKNAVRLGASPRSKRVDDDTNKHLLKALQGIQGAPGI
eukprot:TRINITY_DN2539_c0_g2_i5.p1 TRINITY_DN2539_c0_g2~~TRINITY_DN2539_c0_g2_i5.p1  ORF type:complete len:253 (-),score=37.22 TRINITY_DN2539_c0_g2_i5:193-951(-)